MRELSVGKQSAHRQDRAQMLFHELALFRVRKQLVGRSIEGTRGRGLMVLLLCCCGFFSEVQDFDSCPQQRPHDLFSCLDVVERRSIPNLLRRELSGSGRQYVPDRRAREIVEEGGQRLAELYVIEQTSVGL